MSIKRKLALGLVVVIAIIFTAPWATGHFVKYRANTIVSSINASLESAGVKVILNDYHRGWFSSTAQVAIEAGPFLQGVELPLTRNTIEIWHGPIVFNKHQRWFDFGLADVEGNIGFTDYINVIFSLLNTQIPTVRAYGVVGFDDSFSGAFDLSSTNFSNKGMRIDWGGVFGEFAMSGSGKNLMLKLQTEPLSVRYDNEDHNVGKMLMALQADKTSLPFLVDGTFRFRIEGARLTEEGNTAFALQQGEIDARSKLTKNAYTAHLLANADAVEIEETRYAPVGVKLSLDNLNAISTSQFIALAMSDLNDGASLRVDNLFPLITNGTHVSLDYLTLGLPEGIAQLEGSLDWPAKPASGSIVDIVSAMHSRFKFSLPASLVKKIIDEEVNALTPEELTTEKGVQALARKKQQEDQINAWIKDGYIIEKNGFYETLLTGVGEVYKINGIKIEGISLLIEPPKVES